MIEICLEVTQIVHPKIDTRHQHRWVDELVLRGLPTALRAFWPAPRKLVHLRLGGIAQILAQRGAEMKRSRFTEEQIVKVVKAVEGGLSIAEAVRQFGVSRNTIFLWRKKFAGMEVSDAKKLKALEDENRRLKRVVADLTLDKQMLQDALSRKW